MFRVVLVVGLVMMPGTALGQAPVGSGERPGSEEVQEAPRPALELTPDQFDFGTIWQGAEAQREFTVRNVGAAPLTMDVKSSCGCTVATSPKSPLGPGESSNFTITYDTKRVGKTLKRVTLMTNDPRQPRAEIQVKGEVKPIFTADPGYRLTMYGLSPDTMASRTIRLKNQYEKPLELRVRPSERPQPFEAKLEPIVAGSEYELVLTTVPPLKQGFTRGVVILETDRKELPELEIRVAARVEPRVVLRPTRLTITPRMTKQTNRMVRIQYRVDEPLKIEKVEATHPKIECEVLPAGAVRGDARVTYYTIRISMPAYEDLPDPGADVVIHTDDEEFAQLTVKIIKYDPAKYGGNPDLPDELRDQ